MTLNGLNIINKQMEKHFPCVVCVMYLYVLSLFNIILFVNSRKYVWNRSQWNGESRWEKMSVRWKAWKFAIKQVWLARTSEYSSNRVGESDKYPVYEAETPIDSGCVSWKQPSRGGRTSNALLVDLLWRGVVRIPHGEMSIIVYCSVNMATFESRWNHSIVSRLQTDI